MKIAVVKESRQGEKRVSLTPQFAQQIRDMNHSISIEQGAGEQSGFSDQHYREHGCDIAYDKDELYQDADVVLWLKRPEKDLEEINHIGEKSVIFGFLDPLKQGEHITAYKQHGLKGVALELLPQEDKFRTINPFSKMSELAGDLAYKAAKKKLQQEEKAHVLIVGTGFSGYTAALAAHQDGSRISIAGTNKLKGLSICRTLDGQFYHLADGVDIGEVIQAAQPNIIITTARRFGEPAPKIFKEEHIKLLPRNTVIEDLTASVGGNTYLTQYDKSIVTDTGVRISNESNYPSAVPHIASHEYASCITNLFKLMDRNVSVFDNVLKHDFLRQALV